MIERLNGLYLTVIGYTSSAVAILSLGKVAMAIGILGTIITTIIAYKRLKIDQQRHQILLGTYNSKQPTLTRNK